jgi:hypothetical protein
VTITFDECEASPRRSYCPELWEKGFGIVWPQIRSENGENYFIAGSGFHELSKRTGDIAPLFAVREITFEFIDLPAPGAVEIEIIRRDFKKPNPRFTTSKAGRERVTISIPEGFSWFKAISTQYGVPVKIDTLILMPMAQ